MNADYIWHVRWTSVSFDYPEMELRNRPLKPEYGKLYFAPMSPIQLPAIQEPNTKKRTVQVIAVGIFRAVQNLLVSNEIILWPNIFSLIGCVLYNVREKNSYEIIYVCFSDNLLFVSHSSNPEGYYLRYIYISKLNYMDEISLKWF